MLRGLYTAASGMTAQEHRLDALSNNLANVDLTGYKRDISVHKAFPEMMIRRFDDDGMHRFPIGSVDSSPIVGKLGAGVEYNETFTVFEQGSLKQTENPFDMALEEQGFFVIKTPQGERYTRNGSFLLGKEGLLMTKEGYPVLGEEGPIYIKHNNFYVDKKGRIFFNRALADNPERLVTMEENDWNQTEMLDSLKIVRFDRPRYLKKEGSSLWNSNEESGPAWIAQDSDRPGVLQGFIEAANVNPVIEMVNMIEVNRAYEANQKSISTHDTLLGKLINEAAKY